MRQVRAVDASSGLIWAATAGGVFSFNPDSGEIFRLTAVDGLSNVQTSTIAVDEKRGAVWVGYSDGVIDRIDVSTGGISTFRDIARASQFPERAINRIRLRGDSLLVATDFGIVVFDPVLEEVRDSYTRLGSVTPAAAVRDVVTGSVQGGDVRMWAATTEGVASARLDAVNLQDPSSWTVDDMGTPEDRRDVFALAVSGGRIHAGTEGGLLERSADGTWTNTGATGAAVSHLTPLGNGAVLGTDPFFLVAAGGGQTSRRIDVTMFDQPTSVSVAPDGSVWVGDAVEGIAQLDIPDNGTSVDPLRAVAPAGPFTSEFSQVDVSPGGDLWAGGTAQSQNGFHRLTSAGEWTFFSARSFDELTGVGRLLHVYSDDGGAWVGSEGGGLVHVGAGDELTVYEESNSSLLPAVGTDDFIIVGGVHADSDGDVWVTTRASSRPLHVLTTGGSWTSFGPKIGDGLTTSASAYGRIYVDSFDQKWVVVHDENNLQAIRGLMVLETDDPVSADDDSFRFFGNRGAAGQGLPATTVTSVVEDRDGLVWIGTSSGPAYFVNTGIIARDRNARAIWPQWADRELGTFMLFGLQVNDIAVDPANRIWFATTDGAWLVQAVEGGFEPVLHFTEENSPLFSNEVVSVAVDPASGVVYFSTTRGLIGYQSNAVAPAAEVGDLFVFPNPVRIVGDSAPEVFIEGLVDATQIRIVTPSGALVRRLDSRGGRVMWDARDESGRVVTSGVYLVIAVGENNEGTAYGKVAVIR
ncbi:MAG: regulator [Rhodothermales bacterium]|nr:regulator [Rhodothermales bacterium]